MPWRKVGLVVVGLVVLSWLFWWTVQSSVAEPYVIDPADGGVWTLALSEGGQPGASLLVLRPPAQFTSRLFNQIFSRTMESMSSPSRGGIPIVLQQEYRLGLQSVVSPQELLTLAAETGLEAVTPRPVCIGVRRAPYAGRSRQLYFGLFDLPAFGRFRTELGGLSAGQDGGDAFVPEALVPVMPISGSDGDFASWWPLVVDAETDCVAPLI